MSKTLSTLAVATGLLLGAGGASAAEIDMTTLGSGGAQVCTSINDGAVVCNTDTNSGTVGTGIFPSFLGSPGGQDPTYQHYNTTGSILADNDVGSAPNDNQVVTIGQLGIQDGFAIFRLDINQVKTDPEWFLTVDEISIFLGDGSLTGFATGQLDGVTPLWSLTDGNSIKLNFSLAAGSGNGVDMYLKIPVALFSGYALDTDLQLFSRYGGPVGAGGFPNNDGFEEWSYLSCVSDRKGDLGECLPPTQVPEPVSVALVGLGLLGLAAIRRRRLGS